MTLDEITAYLAGQGLGTVGTSIFAGVQPPTPDACVTVREYGGRSMPTVRAFGDAEVTRELPRVQVVSRGAPLDYTTPRKTAQDAYRAMSRLMSATLSGTAYYTATPLQPPFLLRQDEQQRYEFVFNVEVFKQVTTS